MDTTPASINVFGTVQDSIVDGAGLRFSIFVQGCSHHCPGCHNQDSWEPGVGTETSIDELYERIMSNKLDCGVTFSGGEPFEQAAACAVLARRLKEAGKSIWAYTGYLFEDLMALIDETACNTAQVGSNAANAEGEQVSASENAVRAEGENAPTNAASSENGTAHPLLNRAAAQEFLNYVDVLVDGPFVKAKRSLNLQFRGSSNQRLIDVPKSISTGKLVLWRNYDSFPTKPPSW